MHTGTAAARHQRRQAHSTAHSSTHKSYRSAHTRGCIRQHKHRKQGGRGQRQRSCTHDDALLQVHAALAHLSASQATKPTPAKSKFHKNSTSTRSPFAQHVVALYAQPGSHNAQHLFSPEADASQVEDRGAVAIYLDICVGAAADNGERSAPALPVARLRARCCGTTHRSARCSLEHIVQRAPR